MNRIAKSIAAIGLALPCALASFGVPAAQESSSCVSARQAQQAIESGDILDLPGAARREGVAQKFIGDEARLCDIGGEPHWVVIVQNAYGDSKRIVLNAQAD